MRSISTCRILGLALLPVVVLAILGAGGVAAQSADLVVAQDGSGDYTSIQNAVDDANDTDRIEVRSGTYEESISINSNITLITNEGATIANDSTVTATDGISISQTAQPEIAGFTITDWRRAVSSVLSEGNWTARNLTIRNSYLGIHAPLSSGNWKITNSTVDAESAAISMFDSTGGLIANTQIHNAETGIFAGKVSGEFLIRNVSIDNTSEGVSMFNTTGELTITRSTITSVDDGVDAETSSGNWQIKHTRIFGANDDAVDAESTTGDWKIQNTTIKNTINDGVFAEKTSGNWVITDSKISNTNDNAIEVDDSTGAWEVRDTTLKNAQNGIETEDATNDWQVTNITVYSVTRDGVDASRTTGDWNVTNSKFTSIGIAAIEADETEGSWRVTHSILTNGTGTAIDARNAAVEGSVGYNYWGSADGPAPPGSGGEAYGNLTISPGFYADAQLTNLIRPFAAPVIFAPSDDSYNPSRPHTIGTSHNATGVISSSDVGIRLVNVTEQNNTVVAVNDSSTIPVDTGGNSVNTTISAGKLSGDVEIETQLYNTSAGTVEATDRLNLTAVAGPGDVTGNGAPAQDPDGDGLYEDVNGDGKANLQDLQPFFDYINPAAGNPTHSGFDFNNDSDMNLQDLQPFFNELSP